MSPTSIIDRDGRRIRVYQRKTPGPSKAVRRQHAEQGEAWCRSCVAWLPADTIRSGLCRPCRNADYRRRYAADPHAIRQRARARRRGVAPLPMEGADRLIERFDGRCAYCGADATSWDHIVPVSKGGETRPGNIVPACTPCNSSKNNRDLDEWMQSKGLRYSLDLLDVLVLAWEVAA